MRVADWFVEFLQQIQPRVSDARGNEAAIDGVSCSVNEARLFESVEQPRHVGNLRNESLLDVFATESIGASAAQNSEDIVLRRRDIVGLEHLDDRVAKHGVGSSDTEHRFLLERGKRPGLFDLVAQVRCHTSIYVFQHIISRGKPYKLVAVAL